MLDHMSQVIPTDEARLGNSLCRPSYLLNLTSNDLKSDYYFYRAIFSHFTEGKISNSQKDAENVFCDFITNFSRLSAVQA